VKPSNHTSSLGPAELSRLCGLSTDTLRHYERKGLLHAERSDNGYREYPPQSVKRIQLVQRALSVGFTLDELSRLLKIREGGGAPCGEVRALAAMKLENIEEQLRNLAILRKELSTMLEQWDARLASTRAGDQARLLDMLQELPSSGKSSSRGGRTRSMRGAAKESRRRVEA
jgi:DNA-binding transcriptional MerR regulator